MRSRLRLRAAATACVLASCLVVSRTMAPAVAEPRGVAPGPVIDPFDVFAAILSDRSAIAIHADRTACDRWLSGLQPSTSRLSLLHATTCDAIPVAHRLQDVEPLSSPLNRRGPPGTRR
jgi:hypothetical protein